MEGITIKQMMLSSVSLTLLGLKEKRELGIRLGFVFFFLYVMLVANNDLVDWFGFSILVFYHFILIINFVAGSKVA